MAQAKYANIADWVAAFEKWSGLKVGSAVRRQHEYTVNVVTPTNLLIVRLTVGIEPDGVVFGSSEPAFQTLWTTLCRSDF